MRSVLLYLAGLVAVFAVALGVGRLVGPVDVAVDDGHAMGGGSHDTAATVPSGPAVAGLEVSARGYSLRLTQERLDPGRQRLAFTITDAGGDPLTAYDEQHERDLHLIVVRRDLTGFQHLHPRLDEATGEWSIEADLGPGVWRVLADFAPEGDEPVVLGADLHVAGGLVPEPLGPDRLSASLDGYDVAVGGSFAAGQDTLVTATVMRGGAPVTDLQPYLGANGHLVSLRHGDLGYLHVHPDESDEAGPSISFHTRFPTPGRYRLFLDFRHGDVVRTSVFTVTVDAGAEHAEHGADGPDGGGHDH